MKTLDYIHLDAVAAGKVVEALQQLLADYQVFYTNLRGFHWNIKGHGFFVLHSKFEDMYNDAAEKVDELAERILMLGGVPVNKFSEYLKVAKVKEVSGVSCADEALENVLDTYGQFIAEERKLLSLASESGDEATVALMSDYLKEQEIVKGRVNFYDFSKTKKKVCQNSHLLFYAQSPDFHKLGLCYNLKILYL